MGDGWEGCRWMGFVVRFEVAGVEFARVQGSGFRVGSLDGEDGSARLDR
jgi:hypothetical protein